MLSHEEYAFILQQDLMSFTERAFYQLNPQTALLRSSHIEAIVTKLEACRRGKLKRLIINLPPRN